jgi:hypothetical protein
VEAIKGRHLRQKLVDVLNQGWDVICGKEILYWHLSSLRWNIQQWPWISMLCDQVLNSLVTIVSRGTYHFGFYLFILFFRFRVPQVNILGHA